MILLTPAENMNSYEIFVSLRNIVLVDCNDDDVVCKIKT
jgi:hypothetical protein